MLRSDALRLSNDASNNMACRGIDRFRMPRGRTIPTAIVGGTQMRTALQNLSGNSDVRLTGIKARPARGHRADFRECSKPSARLLHALTRRNRLSIPRHFRSCRTLHSRSAETRDRRRSRKPVGAEILVRKLALPGVGEILAAGREFIAPGEFGVFESAPCGELPFRLSRQILSGPARVGQRIGVGDVNHRVVVEDVDRCFSVRRDGANLRRAGRSTIDTQLRRSTGWSRWREHQRARVKHFRQGAGIPRRRARFRQP